MKPPARKGRNTKRICPKCKKHYQFLRNNLCSHCSKETNIDKGIPEIPDIGSATCPISGWDVELKLCAMRRRTAIKYFKSGKPYQMAQCAVCGNGGRAIKILKALREKNDEQRSD